MKRLLSEQEIKLIRLLPENVNNTYSEMMVVVAKAQDAKSVAARDKEWVAGVDKNIIPVIQVDTNYLGHYMIIPIERWQQLKKDMGVKHD